MSIRKGTLAVLLALAMLAGIAIGVAISARYGPGLIGGPSPYADSCPVSVIGPSAIPGGTDPPILFAVLVYPSSNVNDQFKIEYAVTNSTGAVNTDDVLKKYDTAHTSGISEPFFPVHVGTKVVTEKHTVTMTVRSLTHSCPPTQTTFHVNP